LGVPELRRHRPGSRETALSATVDRHDCAKVRIQRELARANTVLEAAGAVRTEADGFRWADTSKLPATFTSYYSGLVSTAYALGAIESTRAAA
jgi:hypothetical protein